MKAIDAFPAVDRNVINEHNANKDNLSHLHAYIDSLAWTSEATDNYQIKNFPYDSIKTIYGISANQRWNNHAFMIPYGMQPMQQIRHRPIPNVFNENIIVWSQ